MRFSKSRNICIKNDYEKFLKKTSPIDLTKSNQTLRYIYPTSVDKHKNVNTLIEACKILSAVGANIEILLTLLPEQIKVASQKSIPSNIIFLGQISEIDLKNLLKSCDALVFPSVSESFGYPLIDAMEFSVPIIASEKGYVYDVCEPMLTFDPSCSFSIALKMAMFAGEQTKFYKYILNDVDLYP